MPEFLFVCVQSGLWIAMVLRFSVFPASEPIYLLCGPTPAVRTEETGRPMEDGGQIVVLMQRNPITVRPICRKRGI